MGIYSYIKFLRNEVEIRHEYKAARYTKMRMAYGQKQFLDILWDCVDLYKGRGCKEICLMKD